MDMRGKWARPGTMCASVISGGSQVLPKLYSCVDLMVVPFGHIMLTGLEVGLIFVTRASSMTNWPVLSESPMASCLLTLMLDVVALCAACGVGTFMLCIVSQLSHDTDVAAVELSDRLHMLDVQMVTSSSSNCIWESCLTRMFGLGTG